MANFNVFSQSDILSMVNLRDGETKLGEKVTYYSQFTAEETITPESLQQSAAKFVLLGIDMPDVYIKAASQRLLTASKEYLAKNHGSDWLKQ